MSTSVRKAPSITPAMVKERTHGILLALSKNNDFEFNLLMQQLSNWTVAKRRQVFRAILQTLLNGTYVYEKYLRQNLVQYGSPIYYSVHLSALRNHSLDMFVDKVRLMDKNERFAPEKVYTLKKLSSKLMSANPETLSYLFENNIVVLSDKFEFGSPNMTEIDSNIRLFYYMSSRIGAVAQAYESMGLNMEVMLCPEKYQLVHIANVSQNLENLVHTLMDNKKTLSDNDKTTIRLVIQNMDLILRDLKGGIKPHSHVPQDRWDQTVANLKTVPGYSGMEEEDYMHTKEHISSILFKQRMKFSDMIASEIAPKEVAECKGFDPFGVRI